MKTKIKKIETKRLKAYLEDQMRIDKEIVAVIDNLVQEGEESKSLNLPMLSDLKYCLDLGEEAILGYVSWNEKVDVSEVFQKFLESFKEYLNNAKVFLFTYNFYNENTDALIELIKIAPLIDEYFDVIEMIIFGLKYFPNLSNDTIVFMIVK